MATNRLDTLDPALLRPGRIDRKIFFPEPSLEARADILKIHSRKMNLTKDVDLKKIAEKMPVTSGAEVKAVCTEAGMFALRERRTHVNMEDFELAVAKVLPTNVRKCSLNRLLRDWITRRRVFRNYGSRRAEQRSYWRPLLERRFDSLDTRFPNICISNDPICIPDD